MKKSKALSTKSAKANAKTNKTPKDPMAKVQKAEKEESTKAAKAASGHCLDESTTEHYVMDAKAEKMSSEYHKSFPLHLLSIDCMKQTFTRVLPKHAALFLVPFAKSSKVSTTKSAKADAKTNKTPKNPMAKVQKAPSKAEKAESAKAGKAVLFYSFMEDGNMDDLSQHAALPIIEGEKFLINLWVRDPIFERS